MPSPPFFDINSEEITKLSSVGIVTNAIIVKQILVRSDDVIDLTNPIRIKTVLPTGEEYQNYFHPIQFYSVRNRNPKPIKGTDVEFEFVIHYCQYTELTIEKIRPQGKKVEFRLIYTPIDQKKLIVKMNRDVDGYNFSLPQESIETILSKYKNARPIRNIFISYSTKDDFNLMKGRLEDYIIPALTDLSEEQIKELEGIKIIDTETNSEIKIN